MAYIYRIIHRLWVYGVNCLDINIEDPEFYIENIILLGIFGIFLFKKPRVREDKSRRTISGPSGFNWFSNKRGLGKASGDHKPEPI